MLSPACAHAQVDRFSQWIGLRENLQETPIFNGKNHGFLQIFPQSNDWILTMGHHQPTSKR